MSQKPQASKKLGYTPFPDFMATRMVLEELAHESFAGRWVRMTLASGNASIVSRQ